jgi:hypothetical protein
LLMANIRISPPIIPAIYIYIYADGNGSPGLQIDAREPRPGYVDEPEPGRTEWADPGGPHFVACIYASIIASKNVCNKTWANTRYVGR